MIILGIIPLWIQPTVFAILAAFSFWGALKIRKDQEYATASRRHPKAAAPGPVQQTKAGRVKRGIAYFLVGAWLLLPPIWFLTEWCYTFPPAEPPQSEIVLESFEREQDLAKNIWIAYAAILAAICGVKIGAFE
jgi:hypothetical protein